jgi:hypothetical protein
MKKLKLNADDLHVEEFRLQPDVAATRGTVRGLDEDSYFPFSINCPSNGCPSADVSEPCAYCFVADETRTCYC